MKKSELRNIIREEISKLNEAKYRVYHRTYKEAISAAVKYANEMGFQIEQDELETQVIIGGPGRPSSGKTVKHNLELVKGGKVQRKQLHIQVYNTGKSYELNAYIN